MIAIILLIFKLDFVKISIKLVTNFDLRQF